MIHLTPRSSFLILCVAEHDNSRTGADKAGTLTTLYCAGPYRPTTAAGVFIWRQYFALDSIFFREVKSFTNNLLIFTGN